MGGASISIRQRILTGAATVTAVFVAMPLMAPAPPDPTIIYVDDDTCPDEGSGSVGDPYCSIQTAIDAAAMNGDEIVVAPGTYFETINFLGKAIWLHSSDGAEVTIIDGTGMNDSVVKCTSNEGPDTVLEGFTITGGDAALVGGGMQNYFSSPTVTNCTFIGNSANDAGGGMYNDGSNPTLTGCTFSGNSASSGGGMYNRVTSNSTVTNCTFSGNVANASGGGMFNINRSNPTVTNCILWDNSPDEIGGGTPTVTYSNIQGGWPGTGIIDADPLFVDSLNGDYRLLPGSPCIDAADNTAIPFRSPDLDGNPRLVDDPNTRDTGVPFGWLGPIVDMGAYEYQRRPERPGTCSPLTP